MRQISAEEKLWGEIYPEIIFMKPLGFCGFLNHGIGATTLFKDSKAMFVVIQKHTFIREGKDDLFTKMTEEANALRQYKDVLSYCPLVRQDELDSTVTVFQQYRSEESYSRIRNECDILGSVFLDL
jgi:hypothetical protein